MSFATRISLSCKLDPVLHREHEYGLLERRIFTNMTDIVVLTDRRITIG